MYYRNILELIGNTPLVRLNKVTTGIQATVLAKLEYFSPGNSVKDRIGVKMIDDAEKKGLIKPGGTIVEGTSGNTGMALALAAIIKGYKCICTVPDKQSREKIDLLKAVGAEVIVTPTNVDPNDPRSYYSVAKKLSEEIPNSYYPNQYYNLSNLRAHYETTGPEIWEQTGGKVTHFVAGVGTGGTITGTARYLKEKNKNIKIWGIDTYGSVYKKYHETGEFDESEIYPYITEGIGEDIIPDNVDFNLIDVFEKVTDKDGYLMTRKLAREEGLLAGNSSGAAVAGLLQMKDKLKKDDLVVVILPDHATRYVAKAFNDEWMRARGFLEKGTLLAKNIVETKINKDLLSIEKSGSVSEAIKKMKNNNISQMPVTSNGDIVGAITESTIYNKILDNPDCKHLAVENLMEKKFPVVNYNDSFTEVSRLVNRENGAVLVQYPDNSYQIITKYDFLQSLDQ